MPGGVDGTEVRAGGGVFDEVDPDLRRGEGGYNGETETTGGVGQTEDVGAVRRLVDALERRIKELEKKGSAGVGGVEFVNVKQMTPTILKEGVTFRLWREEFERWAGLELKGMQEI